MSNPTEYPLSWPVHWKRTPIPSAAAFKTSLAGALKNVREELARFAKDSGKKLDRIVISSNVTLADQNPRQPGVAVYFVWDGIETCIAVDRYARVEWNLQAIFHCIEAERTKLRHGGLELVRATFRGFTALPPPAGSWYEVLGVSKDAATSEIIAAYQRKRSAAHPDKGGTAEDFHRVEQAYQAAPKNLTD